MYHFLYNTDRRSTRTSDATNTRLTILRLSIAESGDWDSMLSSGYINAYSLYTTLKPHLAVTVLCLSNSVGYVFPGSIL